MWRANKVQNKIHLTRSRSVHLLFPLLSNSLGATVHRRGHGSAFTPKNVEVLQCGRDGKGSWWQAVLAGLKLAAGCGRLRKCSVRGPPWLPGFSGRPTGQHPPSLGPGVTMQWCPCARPRYRSCGRPPVGPSSQGADPDRVGKMTELADIVTCQSCGAGSTEPEARKRGWVASEGRWACDNCLSSGRDSGSERDRLPPSG
jgi:hypothetical protein